MGPWGSVQASLSTQLESVTKESQVRVDLHQHMSGIQNGSLPTPEHCTDFALEFSQKIMDAPNIIAFITSGYESIPKMDRFQRIAVNRDLLAGGCTTDTTTFRWMLLGVHGLKKAIRQVKDIHTFYGINTELVDPMLATVEDLAAADERLLEATIKSYFEDPLGQLMIPVELPSLIHSHGRNPVLQIATTMVGYNPDNHINFDDVGDAMAFVQQFTRITSIELFKGVMNKWNIYCDFVESLRVIYSSGSGQLRAVGSSIKTVNHGKQSPSEMTKSSAVVPHGHQVTGMACSLIQIDASLDALRNTPLASILDLPPEEVPLQHLTLTISNGSNVSIGSGKNINTQQTYDIKCTDSPENFFMLSFRGLATTDSGLIHLQLIFGTFLASTWE